MALKRVSLLLTCLLGLWSPAATAESREEGREAALDSVVRIEADDRFGGGLVLRTVGTGLVVVTAAHVVEDAKDVRVRLRKYPDVDLAATVVERLVDREADVAILRVELSEALVQSVQDLGAFRTAVASSASRLRLVGQPSFEPWFESKSVEVQRADPTTLRVHYRCDDGMSGGGVFDDDWRLVGMTLRRFTAQICEALPVQQIRELQGRWGLPAEWREDSRMARRSDGPVEILVSPLREARPGILDRRQKDALLDARRMTAVLSDVFGPQYRFVESGENLPRLTIELVSYHSRPSSNSFYGVSVRTDIFDASFRVTLLSADGEALLDKEYWNVEFVDHESDMGLARRGEPPFVELIVRLGEELSQEMTQTLAAGRKL